MGVKTGSSAGSSASKAGALISSHPVTVQRVWYPATVIWIKDTADWRHWQTCEAIWTETAAGAVVILQEFEESVYLVLECRQGNLDNCDHLGGVFVSRTVAEVNNRTVRPFQMIKPPKTKP